MTANRALNQAMANARQELLQPLPQDQRLVGEVYRRLANALILLLSTAEQQDTVKPSQNPEVNPHTTDEPPISHEDDGA